GTPSAMLTSGPLATRSSPKRIGTPGRLSDAGAGPRHAAASAPTIAMARREEDVETGAVFTGTILSFRRPGGRLSFRLSPRDYRRKWRAGLHADRRAHSRRSRNPCRTE